MNEGYTPPVEKSTPNDPNMTPREKALIALGHKWRNVPNFYDVLAKAAGEANAYRVWWGLRDEGLLQSKSPDAGSDTGSAMWRVLPQGVDHA